MREGGQVGRHYLQTWFALDLVASFPFELIGKLALADEQSSGDSNNNIKLLAFLKVSLHSPSTLCLGLRSNLSLLHKAHIPEAQKRSRKQSRAGVWMAKYTDVVLSSHASIYNLICNLWWVMIGIM